MILWFYVPIFKHLFVNIFLPPSGRGLKPCIIIANNPRVLRELGKSLHLSHHFGPGFLARNWQSKKGELSIKTRLYKMNEVLNDCNKRVFLMERNNYISLNYPTVQALSLHPCLKQILKFARPEVYKWRSQLDTFIGTRTFYLGKGGEDQNIKSFRYQHIVGQGLERWI